MWSHLTLTPPSKSNEDSKYKSANTLLIIGPRGLQCETNIWEIMNWESSDVFRFDLGRLLQGQGRIQNLKVLITHLLLVLEACNVKPTYRKS